MRCNFQRRRVFQTAKAATFAKAQTQRDHRTPRGWVLEWKDMADAKFSGVRALIFDLDGTLIDSKSDLIHSVNVMLRELSGRNSQRIRFRDTSGTERRNWWRAPWAARQRRKNSSKRCNFSSAITKNTKWTIPLRIQAWPKLWSGWRICRWGC